VRRCCRSLISCSVIIGRLFLLLGGVLLGGVRLFVCAYLLSIFHFVKLIL
jgi:hypothetical protein